MGRFRYLHKYFEVPEKAKKSMKNMAFRRAINTPIQGGAADIVIAAMIKIHSNERLREMGWKLLLQIHDELILEGPEESSTEALHIVKSLMEDPLPRKMLIALDVDAKVGNNWYECK
jgi:DNA polymerase-1